MSLSYQSFFGCALLSGLLFLLVSGRWWENDIVNDNIIDKNNINKANNTKPK